MMKPILTTNISLFIPNKEIFTITPQTNTNIMIDGFPVITSFEWINKQSGKSGFIYGNSIYSSVDNVKFILYDAVIATYYKLNVAVNPTVNAD